MEINISIGERLRKEREDLGKTQGDFAAIAEGAGVPGATRQSQARYEKGQASPSGAYLAAIAAAGADVRYILTGEREGPPPVTLTGEEQLLLNYYRDAPAAMRKAAMAVLLSAGNAPAGQLYQGDGGVQIGSVAGGRVRVGKK